MQAYYAQQKKASLAIIANYSKGPSELIMRSNELPMVTVNIPTILVNKEQSRLLYQAQGQPNLLANFGVDIPREDVVEVEFRFKN